MPPTRLNLYISHAPADRPVLIKLLHWLQPLQEQYGLRIWYNQPLPAPAPVPLPWRLLLFWLLPPQANPWPWHPALRERIAKAHIYLFLTSYKSLATSWIDEQEIVPAVQRYVRLGPSRVRIFPVLLTPSLWEDHSRLSGFTPLGPPVPISLYPSEEDAYLDMMEKLEPVVQDLLRNQDERRFLLDRPVGADGQVAMPDDTFLPDGDDFAPPPPETRRPPGFPLPAWAGWIVIGFIVYLTYISLKPYFPQEPVIVENPFREPVPLELPRENPYYPLPQVFPARDTDFVRKPLEGIEED